MTRALLIAAALMAAPLAFAEEAAAPAEHAHTMIAAADLKWMDGPPVLPPGQKAAVLFGDPGKPGLFVLRVKVPANYKIPPHWHSTDETVTVLSGAVMMGMGDKMDAKTATTLAVGAFAAMPAKTHHFFFTKAAAVIQVSGVGPFDINYINPDDNPLKGKTPAKAEAKTEAAAPAKK
jgi:uncharacterized RmlC-like cupin family protein